MKRLLTGAIICLLVSYVVAVSGSYWDGDGLKSFHLSEDYCFQRISDTTGSLWLAHSNRMALGKPFQVPSPYPDDRELTDNLPYRFKASFPAGSGQEYLYAAGLWVGGIKGNDTLVSHAFDYVAPVPELNPPPCPEGAFTTVSEWADIEHIATAYDTIVLGDTLFRCQVGDCRDWYPLGIKVTSHSYTWESPPYDAVVIVEYTIKNIDTSRLEEGWVGLYTDCDIGVGEETAGGDISGFIDGAVDGNGDWVDLDIGYSVDMDGDPAPFGFDDSSTRGAFGTQVLGLSGGEHDINYNWWMIDRSDDFEWAPRPNEAGLRDLGGSMAVAYGDSNKYYLMSHDETDYNQIEAGLIHPGWQMPGEDGARAAWGGDTRFLVSAGPFDLEPSEEIVFTVAFIAGENAVNNPFAEMWFDPADPLAVADYYELLRTDDLIVAGLAARAIHENGLSYPPPGPPDDFSLISYRDISAAFRWSRKYARDMAGYQLLFRTEEAEWDVAAVVDDPDTIAAVYGLIPDSVYYFAVAAVDSGGAVGKTSPIIELQTGLPHPPAVLNGSCQRTYPVLVWRRSIDSEVNAYRVYRFEAGVADTLLLAELSDTGFVDLSAEMAHTYTYYVTSLSPDAESAPSSPVTLVPMRLNAGILAVNASPGNITSNLVYDLDFCDTLFERALGEFGYSYRRLAGGAPLTLDELALYSLVIIGCENRGGSLPQEIENLLPLYLDNGGRVVLILRHAARDILPEADSQVVVFGPHTFFNRYLMIDSSYIGPLRIQSGYRLTGDLIGADADINGWPRLDWDSVKVNGFGYNVYDGLPYCGFVWPRSPAETVYRYRSGDETGITQGQVDAIRYRGDDYRFYLFNMPLSLMEVDSAAAALRAAVVDLGGHFVCGDINADMRFNVGDIVSYIRWLYGTAEPANLWQAGDVDCSGTYDMGDILVMVNYYSGKGLAPDCCR